ncbi:hypothetical protein [Flagellimonas sp. CMM7]|uniref:beta strand repeat-containing protein n=1 Tax=Flagellimonas sp. CMM7 TaxID=2654676 RepID=UPI0013D38C38|nr:hypothetical protein [Flagellimonas sp. CMM7]UII78791.1 hypothetical protein LV704_14105 [Flagellimonas sp. CMM7]
MRTLLFLFLSLSITVVSSQDSDFDGIVNTVDLDDDNDGILDSVEQGPEPEITDWTRDSNSTQNNIVVTGNSLVSTGTSSWAEAYYSPDLSTLGVGGDYEFSFTIDNTAGKTVMIGLNASGNNTTTVYSDIDYAIYLAGSNFYVYENGTGRGYFGTYASNDTFSVEKSGTTITYKRNGTVFYTSSVVANSADYYIDTSFNSGSYTLGNLTIGPGGGGSFNNDSDNDGLVDALDLDSDNDGIPDNVEAQTTAGYMAPGTFTDGNNDGVNDVYAGGLTPTDTDNDAVPDYLDTDSDGDGDTDVSESGTSAITDATYADVNGSMDNPLGDLANTFGNANEVNYREVGNDSDFDGIVNTVDLDDDNDGILDSVEQGPEPEITDWTRDSNSTQNNIVVTGNSLVSTGTSSWAEAYYSPDLSTLGVGGDYEFSFTIDNTAGKTVMIGLNASGNNTTTVYSDIDYAIYLAGSNFYVYENGTGRGYFGTYASNDTFSVEKSGTTITYKRNGTVFYTSSVVANSADYYIDTSFNSGSYTLGNLTIGPGGGGSFNNDSDNDGLVDALDLDSDNDGIPDNVEAQTTAGYMAPTRVDSDSDGLDNAYDATPNTGSEGSLGLSPENTDGLDELDYLDTDSDNDGTLDIAENGDTNDTLMGSDIDSDGLDDNFDAIDNFGSWDSNDEITGSGSVGLIASFGDLDNDANGLIVPLSKDLDYRDADSDNDGITDNLDLDDDNDGILDEIECAPSCSLDTDSDGIKDYLDTDSDNDNCPDAFEGGTGSFAGYTLNTNNGLAGAVDTTPSSPSYGLPLVAGIGQAVGASKNNNSRIGCPSTIITNRHITPRVKN